MITLHCSIMCTVPSIAPIGFRSTAVSFNSITFQWIPLTDRQANGIVRWYIITCNESTVVSCGDCPKSRHTVVCHVTTHANTMSVLSGRVRLKLTFVKSHVTINLSDKRTQAPIA